MKFLSVRDLKTKSSKVWKELSDQKDMVITSNGRPIAILSSITENNLEHESVRKRTDKITMDEIDHEITTVRSKRKR
jgi:antitoxin (DNA-binding transcriptional repressor) of toxin-antitoxin stability system